MRSVWQEERRKAIVDRASRVVASAAPRWGAMSAPRMLAHITDSLRMALGELQVRRRPGPFSFPPVRHAIIHWLPFPKGAPTAPELLARTATDWDRELGALRDLLDEFSRRNPDAEWPEHAAFGRLSGPDWGVLVFRHTDHHLRQFGV